MSKLKSACRVAVKNLKGSYEELVAVSPHFTSVGVLRNKLSEADTHHRFYYEDALEIFDVTGDQRIPQALAVDFGGVFVPDQKGAELNPSALIMRALEANKGAGELCSDLHAALADRRIDSREKRLLEVSLCKSKQAIADIERCIKEHGDRP